MAAPAPPLDRERLSWHIAARWEEYEGERRANLLRLVGLFVFYSIHLVTYHGIPLPGLTLPAIGDRPFHVAVTMLTATWLVLALGVHLCRVSHFLPTTLKYLATALDLVLLTTMLALAAGPRSSLVVLYFLVVVLTGLRFQVSLIWFGTVGAVAGYLFLLGHDRWVRDGANRVERYQQLIMLASLVLTGVILGQMVRRVRELAKMYASRLTDADVE